MAVWDGAVGGVVWCRFLALCSTAQHSSLNPRTQGQVSLGTHGQLGVAVFEGKGWHFWVGKGRGHVRPSTTEHIAELCAIACDEGHPFCPTAVIVCCLLLQYQYQPPRNAQQPPKNSQQPPGFHNSLPRIHNNLPGNAQQPPETNSNPPENHSNTPQPPRNAQQPPRSSQQPPGIHSNPRPQN